jgi:ribosome recycling factor
MKGAIEHFQHELKGIRAGRASPLLIEGIPVEAYGSTMKIKELGTITSPEPRQLLITPFDSTVAGSISKAIEKANLGIRTSVEGKVVRVSFPELDTNRRKELVNQVHKKKEDGKISIRNCRRDANEIIKKIKADSTMPEDDIKRLEKQIQEMTDKFCKEVEDLTLAKEKEVMEV